MSTLNGAQLNIDALYRICPSCFTESKDGNGVIHRVVDWNKLRALLGENVIEDVPETYDFTWVGKRAAQKDAASSINKTLRPSPEESVNWKNTKNLYIKGDNLEVLKLLQNSYMGKIKMIYIDPPYNTGNDFVYHDDFAMTTERFDEYNKDEDGNRYRRNTDSNGRFHSDWCSMMYSRLSVARTLMSDDGLIFISIDDIEVANIRRICDEIFGADNRVETIIWKNKYGAGAYTVGFIGVHEYILVYSKNPISNITSELDEEAQKVYSKKDDKFPIRGGYMTQPLMTNSLGDRPNLQYTIEHNGVTIHPNKQWVWSRERMMAAIANNEVEFNLQKDGSYSVRSKAYLKDEKGNMRRGKPISIMNGPFNQEGSKRIDSLFPKQKLFDFTKPVELIKYFLSLEVNERPDKEYIVMDFFSGSGTTADAVMQQNAADGGNRKFILVQIPEETPENSDARKNGYKTIPDIAIERIKRAGRSITKTNEVENTLFSSEYSHHLDIGFRVLKCDESNMKEVYFAPAEYSQDLLSKLEDNIKDDRNDLDLLFDCMLRWGVELSLPLSSQKIGDCTVHNVNDGDLVACFDGKITPEVIDVVASMSPLRVVFRDKSFNEASEKMNLFELFKQKCQWSDQEVKNNVKVI